MAAVVLRRLFTSEFNDFYAKVCKYEQISFNLIYFFPILPQLPAESQAQLKNQVLLTLQQNESPNLRRKICEVVAEVVRNLIDDDGNNTWPEFLQFLFQCANSENLQMQESALRIFASVPGQYNCTSVHPNILSSINFQGIFGNQESQYLDIIKQMLHKYMSPPSDSEVRFQAVRALYQFILLHVNDDVVQKHFQDLLPLSLLIIGETIQEEEDQVLLKLLIEMAETVPKYLRPCIENIFEMYIKVFESSEIEDSWRHLALEVMVSLSENAAAMVRKRADKYIAALIPLVLQMMTDLEDDEEWSVSDEIDEDDTSDNNVIAESALDRLACGLGGKTVLPHIVNNISNMLAHENWKQRHAALMAISAAGEGKYCSCTFS